MKVVLIEGASTAQGFGDPLYGGWAARLERDAIQHVEDNPTDPIVVANFAYAGQSIVRINSNLENDIRRTQNGCQLTVVTSVGVNEAKIMPHAEAPILSLDAFGRQLDRYREIVQRLGVATVFVGPQRINDANTTPTPHGFTIESDLVEDYGAVVENAAAEMGAWYIDANQLLSPYDIDEVVSGDGVHPTTFGHKLIYSATEEALVSMGAVWNTTKQLRVQPTQQ